MQTASFADQKKIDSLTDLIKQKEETDKKQNEEREKQEKIKSLIDERNGIFSKVVADKPSFTPVTFGGFRNIRFNLFNDFNYKLDQVILKVHYLKANGREIKSEILILSDIPANSRKILTAPDYLAAGSYLNVSLETVLCKSISLCYYNTGDSIATNDPYKCQ
jgi:hypothetical protein